MGADSGRESQPGKLGSGLPLPSGLQQEFEGLLGSPLAGTRIHTDSAAAEMAASEQANAFTIGRDIVFARDRFAPGTQRGRMLLAHELAHTLQQSSRGAFAPPSVAETEARAAGSAAAQGLPGLVQSAAPVGVQKDDDDEIKKQAKPPSKPKPKAKAKAKPGSKKAKKPAKAKPWTSKRAKASTASTASRREKTMSGMTPDQRRQVEVLEQFAEGAEKAGKDRIGRTPGEEEGVARTRRKEKSEKQRHVDPMNRVSGHHGFPKYLGGKFEQTLIGLGERLHYLYHQELDLVEKIPRKLGSKHYKNLPAAEREKLFRRLIKHAQEFDKKYSKLYPDKRTRIAAAVKRGIREAGFKVPSTRKKAKGGKGGTGTPARKKAGGARTKAASKAKQTAKKAKKAKPAKKPKAKQTPKPSTKAGAQTKAKVTRKSKTVASPPKGIRPKAGKGSKVAKVPRVPKIPKLAGIRAPRIPRLGGVGRVAGRGLAAVAIMALTAWIGAKLDRTEENIQGDIEKLGGAIQFRIEDQAWIIERLVAENPWDPVYANISVGLKWLKLIDPEDYPTDDYMGVSGFSVTVSHKDLSGYEHGPLDSGFGWTSHIDQLTFSVPIELEPEVPEDLDEPLPWEDLLVDPDNEPEEELPPIPMRLPE